MSLLLISSLVSLSNIDEDRIIAASITFCTVGSFVAAKSSSVLIVFVDKVRIARDVVFSNNRTRDLGFSHGVVDVDAD